MWVRGCKQLGSLGVVSPAVIVPGGVFRDRRAVHRGLRDALRRFLRSRCPSRSSLGRGSLAFPAARHGLHRSCLQGADLRGPNRGVGPGLSSRGCDPSWPSSRTDDVLDTWSGWRVPGRLAASVYPPEGSVTGSAPSWASSTPTHCVTDPRIVALAPCRGLRGSLAGLLSWTSQRSPPSTSAARVHSQRGGFEALPERGPAGRGQLVSAQVARTRGFRPLPAPHSLSVRACHSSNPVPPLPFLPASTVYSAHAVQVCCTLQPIMGFAWFQARPGPLLWGSSGGCPILPRRPALSPSLETDRRITAAFRRW